MSVLDVKGLVKKYPTFELKEVGFSLKKSKITGFIGRNGAGKSTTLNSLLGFVCPDAGEISFFGTDVHENECDIKQRVGFVSGSADYYPNKKLRSVAAVTKAFYKNWDDEAYKKYVSLFRLEESKTIRQLSAGMKVKFALALALSHGADLLILDEPTSGLDPVSRDELLEVFMQLADEGKTVLFSTHIISDLEKCADNIIYIKNGEILAETDLKQFAAKYKIAQYQNGSAPAAEHETLLIGKKRIKNGFSALVEVENVHLLTNAQISDADLESIMVHMEREEM